MASIKTPNKFLRKWIRMQLVNKYGKTDCEIDETTSWPDGLQESSRFLPFLSRPVRRTDSVDDIQRYREHFSIARKNQGEHFTWKHYCDILVADLLNADVIASLNKMSIQSSTTAAKSLKSNNPTVAKSVSSISQLENHKSQKRSCRDINTDVKRPSSLKCVKLVHPPSKKVLKMSIQSSGTPVRSHKSNHTPVTKSVPELKTHKLQKRPYLDTDADVQSVSSLDDVKFSQTPSKNVLKKMCTEIRSLAQKTCKTVEKMTTTKYCTTCGDVIRSTTVHKKCSRQRIVKTDYNRPVTTGTLKSSNVAKKRPMCFQSPMIKTPSGTGAIGDDPRNKKLRGKTLFTQ